VSFAQLLASELHSKLVSNAWQYLTDTDAKAAAKGVALNLLRFGSVRIGLSWLGLAWPAIKYRFFALLQLQLQMQTQTQQLWARFDSIRVQGYWVKLQISRLQVDSE